MKFLDRGPEMQRLVGLGNKEGGGLGLIWGRRRIGKTRLLLKRVQQQNGIYTVAINRRLRKGCRPDPRVGLE